VASSAAGNEAQSEERSKPCVLIAGTREAIDVLQEVLGRDFELLSATSIHEALYLLDRQVDLILCNVRFDDSRMFEFLHALQGTPAGRDVPVICCRLQPDPLSPRVRRAIEYALEALGITTFVDRPLLLERYHPAVVDEMLRQLVIDRLSGRRAKRL
jgi:response regulator RpfG family c-di-GMP phosphodiesterase